MIHLKEIARKTGLTVISVLHQPRYDIVQELDDIVLLGRGGRTIFSGPAEKTLEYFSSIGFTCPEHANPAGEYSK
jgi:ABC-type multidrug transport system ATPase subunit